MEYKKPSIFYYRLTQFLSFFAAKIIFKRKYLRNELKGKKGPFVVIANHQAALDFVNLIGATKERMNFVISNSFYNSLPVKSIMNKVGVIPKQQFQTTLKDLGRMKCVVENGAPLAIYPAGLMTEDGLSTPIPSATHKFLKWLGADIYVARTKGTYFCTPKWASKRRRGRTYLDIYKLLDKEELIAMDDELLKNRIEDALLFDAYAEQEALMIKYKNGDNAEGLENVLYKCPVCHEEFSMKVKDKSTIYCEKCGFSEVLDKYGFFHKTSEIGSEIRHVSDWSRAIYNGVKKEIEENPDYSLSSRVKIQGIDEEKRKFKDIGEGVITLADGHIKINANISEEETELSIPTASFASLPFKPGKYLEIQHGEEIFRCYTENGKLVMKFINMVKAIYELNVHKHEQHQFH